MDSTAQAQEKVQDAAGQARSKAREQMDQRSTQAGEQVSAQASDLRSVAEQLRKQGSDRPAKLADQAADRAERIGGYLEDADPDQLVHDLEDFGRRQPLAVVFGGIALGFAASRLLKASSQDRFDGRSNGARTQAHLGPATTPSPPPTAPPPPPVEPIAGATVGPVP